jgi:hypothetical protein
VSDPGRAITFNSLPRAGSTITVPVGSCLQWHGYAGQLTLIEQGGGNGNLQANLIG